jgi:transposase InsO family protein
MDATDRGPRARRSYGRSVAVLYNESRPHTALGGLTPRAFAQQTHQARKVA